MPSVTFTRPACSFVNRSERFSLQSPKVDKNTLRQYYFVYQSRLRDCRPRLIAAAKDKWGNVQVSPLAELEEGAKRVVVGTLFKIQPLKPSILKELSEETNVLPQPVRQKYLSSTDVLVLEDELQRVVLKGNVDLEDLVTGVPVAILGAEAEDGKLEVEELIFMNLPDQLPYPKISTDKYLVFVSGLNFAGKMSDDGKQMLTSEEFAKWICGESSDDAEKISKICRLIVVGDSISEKCQNKVFSSQAKYLTRKAEAGTVEAVKNLDEFLLRIACHITVDIMPGEFDPTNHLLPQQPLKSCLFPHASKCSSIHSLTNPCEVEVDGVTILATSGQNVDDIFKFCSMEDRLTIAEKTLQWGHLLPTGPDTLGVYPYYDIDPFILQSCPNIYVVGNQPEFDHKVLEGPKGQKILVLLIPKFSETSQCVMVNLRDLSVEISSFHVGFEHETTDEEEEVV